MYQKLIDLINSMVSNTQNDNKIDDLNFGYIININDERYTMIYSNKIHDIFFDEFFRNNKKYENIQPVVENMIMDYAARKAYSIRKNYENISKTIVKKEIKQVEKKIVTQEHNCIFSIDGLLYINDGFNLQCGNHILITDDKNITQKYLHILGERKEEFKRKTLVIQLNSQAYNYRDAMILSKKVANILANFLNIIGLVEMGVITRVTIGYENQMIYDVIDYYDKDSVTISNSFPNREIPFDKKYLNNKVLERISSILSKLLERESITSFDKAILLAIKLIGSAIISEDKSYSYFKCVAALECFLESEKDTKHIHDRVEKRTKKLMSIQDDYRKYHLRNNFYNKRSKAGHGNIVYISDQDLFVMKKISSIVLITMIENYDKFNVQNFHGAINSYIKKIQKE